MSPSFTFSSWSVISSHTASPSGSSRNRVALSSNQRQNVAMSLMQRFYAARELLAADAARVAAARHTGGALLLEQAAGAFAAIGGRVAADARAEPLLLADGGEAERRQVEAGALAARRRA